MRNLPRQIPLLNTCMKDKLTGLSSMSALYYQDHHHPKREAEGQGVLPLDVDHVDIPLLVEVGMVDDFLLPGEVVQEVIEAGIVAVVQLEEGLDRGMEG